MKHFHAFNRVGGNSHEPFVKGSREKVGIKIPEKAVLTVYTPMGTVDWKYSTLKEGRTLFKTISAN